jgi:membrane-bound metal-dependent hydrolase YbcI (DUF457 family)
MSTGTANHITWEECQSQFSSLGIQRLLPFKWQFLFFITVVLLVNFIIVCVTVGGTSSDSKVLSNTAWALQLDHNKKPIAFYGLHDMYNAQSSEWLNYDDFSAQYPAYASCSAAGAETLNEVYVVIGFAFILLALIVLRSLRDHILFKYLALLLGLGNRILLGIMLQTWEVRCVEQLPDTVSTDHYVKGGPSADIIYACSVLNWVVFWLNIAVPIKRSDSTNSDSGPEYSRVSNPLMRANESNEGL